MTKEQCIGLIGGKLRGKAVMMLESGYSPDFVYNFLKRKAVKVLEGVPPLTFKTKSGVLLDYTIYGNTGGVGDRTNNICSFADNSGVVIRGITWSCENNIIHAQGTTTAVSPTNSDDALVCILTGETGDFTLQQIATDPNINAYISIRRNGSATYIHANETFTLYGDEQKVTVYAQISRADVTVDGSLQIMVHRNTEIIDFEPYGYKIPIICGDTTTPIYLSTPLNAGYTLSKSDTGVEIPTVSGNNTLAVGTQIQPLKIKIKYRGG